MDLLQSNVVRGEDYRKAVAATLDYVAGVVGGTLGPYGSHVIVQDQQLQHFATKDGYSVLRKIFFKEQLPRTVLDLIKRISFRLVRTVGDGSSTAVVASNEIYHSLLNVGENISGKTSMTPKDLVDALSALSDVLREEIQARAVRIEDDMERIRDVAFVSTNNDDELAGLIHQIFSEAGADCSISVEPGTTARTTFERTSGIEVDRGIINPYMATSASETGVHCDYDNAFVFVCDDALGAEDFQMIGGVMQKIAGSGQPFVIIAKGYDNAFRDFLHVNKIQNMKLPIVAIDIATDSPEAFGKFEDLCAYLGARHYAKRSGEKLPEFPVDRLGRCAKFAATDRTTKFLGGKGDKHGVVARMVRIKEDLIKLEKAEDHIERDGNIAVLRKRMASLSDGMVVVRVGGQTPQEVEARRFLVEDAVFACQSALRHGVVMGGSLAVTKLLSDDSVLKECYAEIAARTCLQPKDAERVIQAVDRAFQAVFAKVLGFIGDSNKILGIIDACRADWETVYNAKTGEYEKFPSTRVINSAETDVEVVRSTFSIIGLLSTSDQFVGIHLVDAPNVAKHLAGMQA